MAPVAHAHGMVMSEDGIGSRDAAPPSAVHAAGAGSRRVGEAGPPRDAERLSADGYHRA